MNSKKRIGAPSNKNSKRAKHDSTKLFFPTPTQFHNTRLPQEFSLPLSLMKYIWENPLSPQVFQKLIKCSKFFFIKNPILVIYHLIYRDEMWRYCKENGCNKPYAFQECSLCYNIFKHDNGEEVHLEDLVKIFSGGKKFFINISDKPYNATCKRFDALIDAFNTVEEVELHLIPDTFNVPQFYKHLKDRKSPALIKICLLNPVPGVDEVIDEILHTETFEFIPPVIGYFQDGGMQDIRTRVVEKYR